MRGDVLSRYEHLQQIVMQHHAAIVESVTWRTLVQHLEQLAFTDHQFLSGDTAAQADLVSDLTVYTAKQGRTRAIDRYARRNRHVVGSDEALMLAAMCRARFSLWRIERRHEVVGVVVADLLRGGEVWLPEVEMEDDPVGATFVARLCEPGQFAVPCSLILPVDKQMMEGIAADPLAVRHSDPAAIAEDPRFAIAVYRTAVAFGVFDTVAIDAIDAAETTEETATGRATEDAVAAELAVADASA